MVETQDMKVKLTKRAVEGAKPTAHDAFLWDVEVPGFGCKVTPRGRRIFVLQYWANGRSRRVTLGRYGVELTVDQARTKAKGLRGQVADGGDPAAARAKARAMPTLTEFAERYLIEHAMAKKKPLSIEADRRNLDKHILPALGRLRVNSITRADVARFHAAMRATPTLANRCLALLSKMFSLSEAWDFRPDGSNPARHVQKYRERKVDRFLSEAELARLGAVLEAAAQAGEHPSVVAAIRMLLLTGCRRNEILTLKWEYVDLERGCLRLPDSKTGSKTVLLGAPALELLAGLPRSEGNPYVLPGKVPGKHYVGLEKAWFRLRKRAGLEDVRLHDLRHTHASVGAGSGESLVLIGALLGHRQAATTQRYAHLSDNPLRAAANRISGRVDAALKGRSGEVVRLRPGRKPEIARYE
jgi:integrase